MEVCGWANKFPAEVGYGEVGEEEAGLPLLFFQNAIDECAEFQLLENLAELLFVRFFANERPCRAEWVRRFDGCEEFGESNHFPVGFHFCFQCSFQLVGMGQQVFDAAEFGNQFCAVFSPTPGQPGMLSEESPISPSISMTCSVD